MDERSTERLAIEGLPVKVWGMDSRGQPFVINTVAHEISYRGARLAGINCALSAGDVIAVQYGSQKARFRVVWVAEAGSARAGQIGIRSAEPDTCIWEQELLAVTPAKSGELDPLAAARRDRRQYPRLRCPGNVQLRQLDSSQYLWAKLGDISLGGCYIETASPLAVGSKLQLVLHMKDVQISTAGEVRSSVPALGMGVQFTSFQGDSRELLQQLITRISPPPLTGKSEQSSPLPAINDAHTLIDAIRDHFESNNILTSKEFDEIIKVLDKKKPAAATTTPGIVKKIQ